MAEPPSDDGGIDQALTDLDVKIWSWTDAMLAAQTFLKRALTSKEAFGTGGAHATPSPRPQMPAPATEPIVQSIAPSMESFMAPPSPSVVEAAVNEWRPQGAAEAAPPPPPPAPQAPPAGAQQWPAAGGDWEQPAPNNAQWSQPATNNSGWTQPTSSAQWPSNPGEWPSQGGSAPTSGDWPTTVGWPNPDNSSAPMAEPKKDAAAARKSKSKEKPVKIGPSDEELAARAAHEVEVMSALDETTARRVRLLRRLDPDAKIEQLVEKARQTSAEPVDKNDKSSWWRRK